MTASDVQSISAMSKGSRLSKGRQSVYSSFGGSRWGTTGGVGDYALKKLEIKPTIQEQMLVTKEWWESLNPNLDVYLPLQKIKRFFVKKALAQDLELAEKEIFRYLGKVEELEYDEFYKVFTKGIFRVALQDMLLNIE